VTAPLTDQIRNYFADLEAQHDAIDVDALLGREPSRLRAVDGSSTYSTQPGARWWASLAAAAAVVALVTGLVITRSVADVGPAEDVIPTIDDGTSPLTSDGSPVSVPTTDVASQPSAEPVPTTSLAPLGSMVAGHGCPFGIAGDPIVMEPGPVDPLAPRFDAEPGQNIAHTVVGSQVAEVRVPGFTLQNSERWRMEDIELARGPAKVWLNGPPSGEQGKPFVQLRWSSDAEETCGSFTVTVDGGTEDANRQFAIDLAQRILLPSELGDPDLVGASGGPIAGLELAGTEWNVASTRTGTGPNGAMVAFDDVTVTWEDGCATVRADYHLDREQGILALTNRSSTDPGCPPPTVFGSRNNPWSEIRAVMNTEQITVAYVLDFPGGAGGVESLVRLGEPMGVHILLAPD
jgi:hypothetical protein